MPAASLHRFSNPSLLVLCIFAAACGERHHAEGDWRQRVATAPAASSRQGETPRAETRDPVQLHALTLVDGTSQTRQVSCVSCHSLAPLAKLREQQLSVHGGERTLSHGNLSCKSCHDQSQNDRLTLAGGDTAPLTEAITLCGQCHGPQYRDYKRGSHGGMMGYWDRSVGTRERKHCVDCHEPHAPAFRPLMPVLPPHGSAGKAH